ncbi:MULTISPECIES: hypothetical protein [unclassified Sphingomonas]|uniref:hypothetical protein n=1 Tax=unclassified Sphingomonas TaxID=196159 RepID=UPI002269E845|nr:MULTISPECIES: hypothetical protein [unclassified Sphingomonas]
MATDLAPAASWINAFQNAAAARDAAQWVMADLVAAARDEQPKLSTVALGKLLDFGHVRLGRLYRVAQAFPLQHRDTRVSFEVHEQLAAFPAEERPALLSRAVAERWSERQARKAAVDYRQEHAGFVDEDRDNAQAVHIMRAWNRASRDAREYFADLQEIAGLGLVDEETACAADAR